MKILKIVFTRSKKKFPIGSWLIRIWTGKKYSHVSRMTSIKNIKMYYQSNENKANYEVEEVFLRKHEIVQEYTLEVPSHVYDKISIACLENCGKKYGYMQNIGVAIVDVCRILGISIDTPWKDGQNCSELIYRTVLDNIIPDLKMNPDLVKPHHIENLILKHFIEENGIWRLSNT